MFHSNTKNTWNNILRIGLSADSIGSVQNTVPRTVLAGLLYLIYCTDTCEIAFYKCSLHAAYKTVIDTQYTAFHQQHSVAKCQHRPRNQFISNQRESKLWHGCTDFFFFPSLVLFYVHFSIVFKNELVYQSSFRQFSILITCAIYCGLTMSNLKTSDLNGRWR